MKVPDNIQRAGLESPLKDLLVWVEHSANAFLDTVISLNSPSGP